VTNFFGDRLRGIDSVVVKFAGSHWQGRSPLTESWRALLHSP